ncbi:MAG: YeeE/YedE family protein [Myxococcales bacterium]|nr:YeeE/YedE family protein [Myxococcales bacterium]
MNPTSVIALVSGSLFAAGLALSGMTRPEKVLGFLSVSARWDPSLALVMGGAIAVMAPVVFWTRRRGRPLFETTTHEPAQTRVDGRLILGSVLFGVGWGLVGYCPGPALAALVTGSLSTIAFVAAMLAGLWIVDRVAPAK